MELLVAHFKRFGLEVHTGSVATHSESKTKAMFFPGASKSYTKELLEEKTRDIQVHEDKYIPFTKEFTYRYLGSKVTPDLRDNAEISRRIQLARAAFATLKTNVLANRKMLIKTKTQVYESCVLSQLLFGCESWSCSEETFNDLEIFHNDCMRGMLNHTRLSAHYFHGLRTEDLHQKCKIPPIRSKIELQRAR